jgi:membrane protease YdiL (CAAX protease family)
MAVAPRFDRVRVRWLPLWVAGILLALVPIGFRFPELVKGEREDVLLECATYAAILAWVLWQCSRAGVRPRALLGPVPRATDWKLLAVVPPLIAITVGCIYLLWLPISFVAPELVQSWVLDEEASTWDAAAPLRSMLAVLVGVVVASVVEELLFRGVVLHRWAHRWSTRTAVLASALVFGLGHADILGATAFGIVMALLYVRTGALWVPIACHMLNNGLAVLAEVLGVGGDAPYTVVRFQREWYVGAVALVGGVAGLYLLRQLFLPPTGWQLPALVARDGAPLAAPAETPQPAL